MKNNRNCALMVALALSTWFCFSVACADETIVPQKNAAQSLMSYSLDADPTARWKLPKSLREISGLTMTQDQRLFAHNDEKGSLYEIDYRSGTITKTFKLAGLLGSVADDFEGIAADSSYLYLVTSSGQIYQFREGVEGQSVPFEIYSTGVGRDCEIEGLAFEPADQTLLLMCKKSLSKRQKGLLTIFRWSPASKELVDGAHITIPISDFSRYIKGKKFQPSGIERHPQSGNYFVVAARQRAIAEVAPNGRVLAVATFAHRWHSQTEGITFAADGTLIVADEGGKKRASLTLYPIYKK